MSLVINFKTYKHQESDQWITFIHGAGGSSSIWYKQIKAFKKHMNVLLVDLRGHGNSKSYDLKTGKYTFQDIADDVLDVLNHLKINKSHFVGISLGTLIIRQLADNHQKRVASMVMGGAILKMNFRSQVLMKFGNIFKYVVPYLLLYKLFAFIIMPRKRHKESRSLFIREAKKLYQKEFIRWFKLTTQINPLLKWFRQSELSIPTLYVMGDEDFMFLPAIKKIITKHTKHSSLKIIENCGHVVNVEKPLEFNSIALNFIQQNK